MKIKPSLQRNTSEQHSEYNQTQADQEQTVPPYIHLNNVNFFQNALDYIRVCDPRLRRLVRTDHTLDQIPAPIL